MFLITSNKWDKEPIERCSFDELCALAQSESNSKEIYTRADKDSAPFFFAATFGGDGRCISDNLLQYTALVFDFDKVDSVHTLCMKSATFDYLLYTSLSNNNDRASFRVVIPFSRPVTKSEWYFLTNKKVRGLPFSISNLNQYSFRTDVFDQSSFASCRGFIIPLHTEFYKCEIRNTGCRYDPTDDIANGKRRDEKKKSRISFETPQTEKIISEKARDTVRTQIISEAQQYNWGAPSGKAGGTDQWMFKAVCKLKWAQFSDYEIECIYDLFSSDAKRKSEWINKIKAYK